jgi:hypothetical protein
MNTPRAISILSVFLCAACSGTPLVPGLPSPTPVPETTAELPRAGKRSPDFWKITPSSQTRSYSSLLTTVITQNENPSSRRDSLTTQIIYSLSATQSSDTLRFSGFINTYEIEGIQSQADISEPTLPIRFTGISADHVLVTQTVSSMKNNSTACTDPSRFPIQTIQRNLFSLPLEITAQQTWTDSTVSIICNGTLPVTLTSVRTLQAKGESEFEGTPVLVLEENEKTFSKGEGSQGQHRIIIETRGVTTGRIYVERISGQLLTVNSTNSTLVSIQTSGRIQHFQQKSTEITRQVH